MAKAEKTWDYIILGGGSAGCVLASRLSEDPDISVLLVEAGGSGRGLFVDMPVAGGFLFGRPEYDWGYSSVPQDELCGRQIYYPRGRGLGGSSLLNGMIYTRGNALDYDGWRQKGLTGWGYEDLLPYFKRSEGHETRDDAYHSTAGPLRTRPAPNFGKLDEVFLEACQQMGLPFNPDFNGAKQEGCGIFDVKVYKGRRSSISRSYLRPAGTRKNLAILPHTRVLKVLFDKDRALGAEVNGRAGPETLRADREVILSLGAFASPQLLMLSGVGPADHLRGHDIPVVADVSGVGSTLYDHLNLPFQCGLKDPSLSFAKLQRLDRAIWMGVRYLLFRDGPGAGPFWSTAAFDALGGEIPEFQVFMTPMVVHEDPENENNKSEHLLDISSLGSKFIVRGKRAASGFNLDINLMQPESSGTVRLASTNPEDHPLIDPQFLSRQRDRDMFIKAVKWARDLINQPAMREVAAGELSPGIQFRTDEEILNAAREIVCTGHHPVSTCKMGIENDPMAVVDGELRVRGVEGLRVMDASIFPTQITGNPNGPIAAMAEKAADMILGKTPLQRAILQTGAA